MSTHHGTRGHEGHRRAGADDVSTVRLLELDAQVLAPHLAGLTAWLADRADRVPVRILDLGSGPGTGSLALAHRFPTAAVTAVDVSPQMLHRVRERAVAHGVADRVGTLEADLDRPWSAAMAGPYDLGWAAAFLHHAAAPSYTLAQAFSRLRPGGLLAVTEMDFFPRFLPEDAGAGRAGLEARLHAATDTRPPHDWTEALERTGFLVEERRPFDIRLDNAQAGPALNAYARTCLAKLRSHAAGLLAADDVAALDELLDDARPHGVARRGDLSVRTTRTTWIARRP
ncbi:methyltransferase domain-containing protein [Streptomyces parvulus]|uniref:methyltransferase domain-containing protein n=1 Tax=Streptomyces parvulus TaxID=146923 RepID=UPI0033A00B8F